MHSDFSLSSTPPRNRLLCHSHCSCVHCDSRLVRKYSITILYISRYFQSYYIAYWFADARHCDSKANPKTVINSFHINPPPFLIIWMEGALPSVSTFPYEWSACKWSSRFRLGGNHRSHANKHGTQVNNYVHLISTDLVPQNNNNNNNTLFKINFIDRIKKKKKKKKVECFQCGPGIEHPNIYYIIFIQYDYVIETVL